MTNRHIIQAFVILLLAIVGFWAGFILRLVRLSHEPVDNRELLLAQFMQAGDGDAGFVTSPGGLSVLIDAGPNDDAGREIVSQIQRAQQRAPRIIVLTNARPGSIGGLPYVLTHTPFRGPVVLPCAVDQFEQLGGTQARDIIASAMRRHIQVYAWHEFEASALQSLLSDPVVVATPIPIQDAATTDPTSPGAQLSVVTALAMRVDLKLDYGSRSLFYAAGLTGHEEDELIAQRTHVSCDVLAGTNGGHKGGLSSEFLALAGPSIVTVSTSPDNLPDPQALRRLSASAATVERTDQLGTITLGISSEPGTPVVYYDTSATLPKP